MPTPGERHALIFIASVAALGVAARGWRELHPQDSGALAGGRTALARQIEAVDSAIAVTSSKRKPRPPKAAAPRAEPAQSASTHRIRSFAPIDTQPRDPRQSYWDRSQRFDSLREAMARATKPSPGHQLSPDVRHPPTREKWTLPPVDLDIASVEEVAALPFVGPALARRIVTERVNGGPFGGIAGLERVPGITPAFSHRLEPFVTFSLAPRLGSAGERPSRSKSERRPGGESRP